MAERLRAARDAGKGATPVTNWPCVFAPPPQAEAEFPPAATEGLKNLIRARIALENGTGRWPDDVKVIRSALLAQFSAGFDPKAPQTTATHYAAVAARECIARHDPELAGQLLKIGRAFSESDEELAYLGRILEREAAPVEKPVAR